MDTAKKRSLQASLPFRLLHVKLHGLRKRAVLEASTLNAIKTIEVPSSKKQIKTLTQL